MPILSALRSQKSDEQPRVSGPCVEKQLAWNLTAGVPQREYDNHDVVERPEDRDELGNHTGVAPEPTEQRYTGGQEADQFLHEPRRQTRGDDEERRPRADQDR